MIFLYAYLQYQPYCLNICLCMLMCAHPSRHCHSCPSLEPLSGPEGCWCNLQAVMQDLTQRRGLRAATDVVLVGASAGGLGVMLQADDWAEHIRAAAQRFRRRDPKIVGPPRCPPLQSLDQSRPAANEKHHRPAMLTRLLAKSLAGCVVGFWSISTGSGERSCEANPPSTHAGSLI